jgi:hypothetical protein
MITPKAALDLIAKSVAASKLIEPLTADNLTFFMLGCDSSHLIDTNAVQFLLSTLKNQEIFSKLIRLMISTSHGNTHNTSTRLPTQSLQEINLMQCRDMSRACSLIADSCKLFFNEKSQKKWKEAENFVPFDENFAESLTEWFYEIEKSVISRVNELPVVKMEQKEEIDELLLKFFGCVGSRDSKSSKHPYAIYTMNNDGQHFVSVDVIQSNWTALKILHKMKYDVDIGPYQEIVKSVVEESEIPMEETVDERWGPWIKDITLNSKLLRNKTLNKSNANTPTVSLLVQSLTDCAYDLMAPVLEGKGSCVVRAYDEVIFKLEEGLSLEELVCLEQELRLSLSKMEGVVRVEIYKIHGMLSPTKKFMGVCREFVADGKLDFKCVEPSDLVHAYEITRNFIKH